MRKTKIVATLGPACKDKGVLKQLIDEGVDVCRINFSHGTYEDHTHFLNIIDDLNKEHETTASVLADLQGPKLRVGEMESGSIELMNGAKIIITTQECIGTTARICINYDDFAKDVKEGEKILVDDGKLELQVFKTNEKDEVELLVVHGGKLMSNKGVNLPNTNISLPNLTEKDLADLDFILENDIDWVGLSFVRSAGDIIDLRKRIKAKNKDTKIIAKIEKPEALDDLDAIIRESDAIMVARGDLGVEVPMESVPIIQKDIVNKCLRNCKPCIIATQMMESMITNVTPTRAEVNDVANAVLDGADAVMLSAETSVGKFPFRVVEVIKKIVEEVEKSDKIYHHEVAPAQNKERFLSEAICYNATSLAHEVNAKAIITMTFSGYTAFRISAQRPKADIFVMTGNQKILNMLSLVWGVKGIYYNEMVSTDKTISDSINMLKEGNYVKSGDLVLNIASMPIEASGMTNMVKLSEVV